MKLRTTLAVIAFSALGGILPALAQYGGYDDGYRERRYERRDRDFDDTDRRGPRAYREDGRRGRDDRRYGFDEREYLRCNPDVRRAVQSGQATSAEEHYRLFGRREGRRLSC